MIEKRQNQVVMGGMLCLLALASVLVLWPGVTGSFLHDDKATLRLLGEMGGITDLNSLRHFVFGGVASELGRPVALLSFVWDGQNWPTEPRAFIVTNMLIHAVNTLLLFAVVFKLCGLMMCSRREARMVAFIAALLWAIHPMQLASVLYIVQRMTELAMLFSLLAIGCYLHGRRQLMQSPGIAYWWMSGGLVLLGGLALLSKENAALLPMLLLVLEFTLLRRLPRPAHWRYWAALFLWLPTLLIIAMLAYRGWHHADYFAMRDYSMVERLLTQSRVIMDYLFYLLLPLDVPSVYNDGFPVSTGWLSPLSTLLSILAITAMLVVALVLRRRQPMISFAILWFFCAHLLESTVLNLELYYLHRNYLPVMGFFIAGAYYFVRWAGADRRKLALVVFPLLVWGGLNYSHSSVWGKPFELARIMAQEHPDSTRAQLHYAGQLFSSGEPDQAIEYLDEVLQRQPDFLGAQAFRVVFLCTRAQLQQSQFVALVNAANVLKHDTGIGPAMHRLFDFMRSGACRQIKPGGAVLLLDALIQNPLMHQRKDAVALFYNLKGSIYFHQKDLRAMDAFVKAYEFDPSYDTAFRLANLYGSLGVEREARLYATMARQFDAKRRLLVPSRAAEVDEMLARHFH